MIYIKSYQEIFKDICFISTFKDYEEKKQQEIEIDKKLKKISKLLKRHKNKKVKKIYKENYENFKNMKVLGASLDLSLERLKEYAHEAALFPEATRILRKFAKLFKAEYVNYVNVYYKIQASFSFEKTTLDNYLKKYEKQPVVNNKRFNFDFFKNFLIKKQNNF